MALKRKIMYSAEEKNAQIERWKKRPYSWSQHSQFTSYSKEDWRNKYILGGESHPTKEMLFGSFIDKKIQDDPSFIPELKREANLQMKLHCDLQGITLVGIPDAIDLENRRLRDFKTGKANWDKKRADETGQLTWYLMMVYFIHNIAPEEFTCYIDWLETKNTEDGDIALVEPAQPKTFETRRTKKDILMLAADIINTRIEMEEFARNHV